jgi:uncharacterized repeat protein (TIGR03833 family)
MADRLVMALIVMAAGFGAYWLFQAWHRSRASSAFEPTGKATVLYFRSDTCVPCLTQSRFLDQVRGQFGDRVAIEKIDADAERERADRFGVFTVPTTLVIDPAGKVRHANYGLVEPGKLATQLREIGTAWPEGHAGVEFGQEGFRDLAANDGWDGAEERLVVPPTRNEIRVGARVQIVEKQNQRTGASSEGVVARILTSSSTHPHGIKVMLEDGRVGRVKVVVQTAATDSWAIAG